jgi:hypothetical protein
VGADRPGDADVPPDDEGPDRRDDQGGGGDQAAQQRNSQAETRTRQEYYANLRVTVSREQSVVARQTAAEEQVATEKWQETKEESRWMWSEYQRKWPPAERSPADRSTGPSDSWRGDRGRSLDDADNSRVEAECDRIAKREEERISPAMRAIESQDPDRHLIGFEHRRKGRDRIKEKVYDKMQEFSYSAEQAVSLVSDTIRYTFQYREAHYTQGVWTDLERLKGEGFKLHQLKNSWSGEEYKGINSQWIDPDTGQLFEVQFHTRISFEAKQLTHDAYERIRTQQTDQFEKAVEFEKMVLKAFQRKVSAEVPIPPGAADIPDYSERGIDGR